MYVAVRGLGRCARVVAAMPQLLLLVVLLWLEEGASCRLVKPYRTRLPGNALLGTDNRLDVPHVFCVA